MKSFPSKQTFHKIYDPMVGSFLYASYKGVNCLKSYCTLVYIYKLMKMVLSYNFYEV